MTSFAVEFQVLIWMNVTVVHLWGVSESFYVFLIYFTDYLMILIDLEFLVSLQTLFTEVGAGETVGHSFSTLTALLTGRWTPSLVLVLKSGSDSVVI